MAVTKEITYFNSFLVKKVIQKTGASTGYPDVSKKAATWPSLPWNPEGYPLFPLLADTDTSANSSCWYIEESRIRGGYNNKQIDFGVKAYLTEDEDKALTLINGLIYSGLYNLRTGINQTNVFSTGENITKELDPSYGAIQKLFASDTNLIIFQEDKVSNALIDKDAIYTADGNPSLTATQLVLGQISQYSGEYGISDNPESFAFKGYRMYFTDKNRGAVMRLSRDGLTEISSYGMRDYFRDKMSDISKTPQATEIELNLAEPQNQVLGNVLSLLDSTSNLFSDIEYGMTIFGGAISPNGLYVIDINSSNSTVTLNADIVSFNNSPTTTQLYKSKIDRIVGSYDNYNDKYVVSMQNVNASEYNTLSFNESNNGWTSFWDYDPSFGGTLNNTYYTCKLDGIWKHYEESVINNNRGNFYGTYYPTLVQLSFNPNVSFSKNFQTVNYEGSNGWQVDSFLSDPTGALLPSSLNNSYKDSTSSVLSYNEGAYIEAGTTYRAGFNLRENKYYANLVNVGTTTNGDGLILQGMPGQVLPNTSVSGIKGFFATVTISTDKTTDIGGQKTLFAVSSNYTKS